MPTAWLLRPIRPADDVHVATTIREVMTEHACTGEGFAIHDPEVAQMSDNYPAPSARYYVVVDPAGQVVGGAGFARLHGTTAEQATCELRKMYFRPAARGQGLAAQLLALLLDEMRVAGYRRCYLETTSWMQAAQRLYERHGFSTLPAAEGCTGHHGCDRFYARSL
ncbi:MAG: GNAT family N-acetyltransferase [Planctomycetes bacterium]|nr:GNAT family N-acetyltransferase [Planctomycetota bacterium]